MSLPLDDLHRGPDTVLRAVLLTQFRGTPPDRLIAPHFFDRGGEVGGG